jgi:hypothetical protein
MITIQDIIDYSKEHYFFTEGRITRIGNKNIEFSIVGGARGLYGDFINDFEVAIIDNESGGFVTKFFCYDSLDDVIPWMKKEDLETLVNQLLKKEDFQVR